MSKHEMPTHKELVEALIDDENIADNIDVCDDYPKDKHGNSVVTLSFDGSTDNKEQVPHDGILILLFNDKGRLVSMEMAVSKKGKQRWLVAASNKFVDFKRMISGITQ